VSDTPKTDAKAQFFGFNPDEGEEFVQADFARELERENDRLKDTLKTGEMPDPVWSKDDLCFMYRKALEERDELAEKNVALRADKERLDWLEKHGATYICSRAAIDAARKEQPCQS